MSRSTLRNWEAKSYMRVIDKVWGKEIVIVNCAEYCSKFLVLKNGAQSSLHFHKTKKETFYCVWGTVALHIEGKDYMLTPFTRPKTIYPQQKHFFRGITGAIVLEVSTEHNESDTVRLKASKAN